MKKLLVLSLVLTVIAVANAGMEVNTPDAVAGPTGSFTIEFKVGDGNLEGYDIGLVLPDNIIITNAVLSTNGSWITPPGAVVGADNRWSAGAFPAFGFNGLGQDDVILAIDYTGGVKGDVIDVQMYSGQIGGEATVPGSIGCVEIIPEPATMALLTIGGLFLRRRK